MINDLPKSKLVLDYNELSHIYNALKHYAQSIDMAAAYLLEDEEEEVEIQESDGMTFMCRQPTDMELELMQIGLKIEGILDRLHNQLEGGTDQ